MRGPGRPWVKGQSGNPSGRRKSIAEECSQALERRLGGEEMAGYLDGHIKAGSEKALFYAYDRILGRPAQAIQISGDAERPLHGLIGVVGREMLPVGAPTAIDAPIEGELVVDDEQEPDDTGVP